MRKKKQKLEKNNFIVKLITKKSNKENKKTKKVFSNLKTNGTNRKFVIFLKLMALTESL